MASASMSGIVCLPPVITTTSPGLTATDVVTMRWARRSTFPCWAAAAERATDTGVMLRAKRSARPRSNVHFMGPMPFGRGDRSRHLGGLHPSGRPAGRVEEAGSPVCPSQSRGDSLSAGREPVKRPWTQARRAHRMFPVCPSEYLPGCGQTHRPCGSWPTFMRCVIRPVSVSKTRSEEHTSELQSRLHLVCRLLLEKKKKKKSSIVAEEENMVDRITQRIVYVM